MTKQVWIADPQDHTPPAKGFQGNYFRVHGVTDRDHESLGAVCAILDRRKHWRKVSPMAGFDAMYQWHDGRAKFLGITTAYRWIV